MRCVLAVVAVLCACSTQPVIGSYWTSPVPMHAQSITKLDLVLAIDNSSSMGDKQAVLANALPVLMTRLLHPAPDEFRPVPDIHVAVVSSSLGGGGSPDQCLPMSGDPTHQDDAGHALNRTLANGQDGPPIANAKPVDGSGGNFLAWLPTSNPSNAGSSPGNVTPYDDAQEAQLIADFQSLVVGVQERGCGLEAQLESWYRFLIQPDPYDSIEMTSDNPPRATLVGVDSTLLKMRHDFLRPDSVVAILQITDEDDSWSDPLWLGGYGWTTRTSNVPGGPGGGAFARGTSECDQPEDINNPTAWGPNNPDCTSCMFPESNKPISGEPIGQDPNCNSCLGSVSCQKGWYTAQQDGLNVRYGSQYMRARYGLDSQFDVQRYVDGLTLATVPDRDHDAHDASEYATKTRRNCTNPLFAWDLPDGTDTTSGALCNLKVGPRTPDLVFYGLIGGVPSSLVEDGNLDWKKIVGADPRHYVLDGIDPHMIQSLAPRAGLPFPLGGYSLGSDPENGREWNTWTSNAGTDLQYACTFDLPKPKDCTLTANAAGCDCLGTEATAPDGPPLCDPTVRTTQIKGKAYPTIRELRVAQGLGKQAMVDSICTNDLTHAMNAFVDRMKPTLTGECLAAPLPTTAGEAACLLLVGFMTQSDQSTACAAPGLSQPPASLLQLWRAQYMASIGDAASGPIPPLCVLRQLTACDVPDAGWCYMTNTIDCRQKIAFSASGQPGPGTQVLLECSAGVAN